MVAFLPRKTEKREAPMGSAQQTAQQTKTEPQYTFIIMSLKTPMIILPSF
jgi:hypothetical protein